MIQDKDFTLRLIRQLTQALEKILLGKPEESLMQKDLDLDFLMKDIFKFDFKELSSKSISEIDALVEDGESKDHVDYYEMLGNVFQFKFNQTKQLDFAEKTKYFYERYLHKSGIFALPIINRISVLKKILKD
ncbi:hypothetical protein G6R40_10090 [Chryseobacterium sp. POL2]|uniref:hypothetical protein n=1 Tax=Chryseobacterium sp. POL2 TaxID=2713414 RepID=UPI0013E12598|nr:hypothetical protein [Chryseobacterium sp. POL2]QIG89989.1 hypothetical protein G6R40_10090 [Chryseobacterium sp. POL2]